MSESTGRPRGSTGRYFLRAFQLHNDQVAALVGLQYTKGTLTKYKSVRKQAATFIQHHYGKPDVHVREITPAFIADFEFWLKSVKRIDHNTTMKYLAGCRKIVLRALRQGWITRDPFVGVSLAAKEVHRHALTETELAALAKVKLPKDHLLYTRDIFLFCCYTGLAYVDVKKLRYSDIVTGVDQRPWLNIHRQKTQTLSRIPLLPAAIDLLLRYRQDPGIEATGVVFTVKSNQKMNGDLKDIAGRCGIRKHLTVHIARHTFATTVTLSNGVPMETVSKMLGHKSIRTTQLYAKIVDRKVSQDMAEIRTKYGGTDG